MYIYIVRYDNGECYDIDSVHRTKKSAGKRLKEIKAKDKEKGYTDSYHDIQKWEVKE